MYIRATNQAHVIIMTTKTRAHSDILDRYRPSFTEGMARAFDVFGHMPVRECRDSSPEAVAEAIAGDWATVVADLRGTMLKFEAAHGIDVLVKLETSNVARDAETT